MARDGTKPTRQTDQDHFDKLIDWYEQFKPYAGKVIDTTLPDRALRKFAATTDVPKEWTYRGRTLRQVGRRK